MADFAGGKIQAFVGPQELGAADNLEKVIVDFIAGAEKTLDIAVQELDSEPIAQAIIDARWRGISVRVFLEQDYLDSKTPPRSRVRIGEDETEADAVHRVQWTEVHRHEDERTNRDILAAFLRNGIDVKADYNPNIFHQKFIVRDYRRSAKPASAVLTGSTNFTEYGTHRNLNNVIIFHDVRICKLYRDEFNEIRTGTFGPLRERRYHRNRTVNIEGIPVRVLFAPDDAPELEITKQILKARESLDFAIFTFAGSSAIDDALTMLRAAGRRVRGVMDPTQGRQWWSATKWLHDEGIHVYFPRRVPGFGKVHHKLMVIDDNIVVAGSMNYTAPANELNDENIFVLGSPYDLPRSKGGPVDHAACAGVAAFFRAEIDRIISQSDRYAGTRES